MGEDYKHHHYLCSLPAVPLRKYRVMKRLLLLVMVAFSLSSCYHVYYAPNTPNASLLSQKGETRVNALFSGGFISRSTGGELHLATALSNHVGLIANGYAAGHKKNAEEEFWNWGTVPKHPEEGHGAYLEAGAGYFHSLDVRNGWIGEVYGGYGVGTVSNDYGFGDHSRVNCSKLFLQPALGFKAQYVEIALVPRFSYIHWTIKDSSISDSYNVDHRKSVEAIAADPSLVTFEPAFVIRAGWENVKAQMSLALSTNRRNAGPDTDNLIEGMTASIGVSFMLPTKKGK
jgi:hypothetical protein